MLARGCFIVVEGCDRAGKSTQCARLVDRLQQHRRAQLLKFPDRTTQTGQMIDSYLKQSSQLDDHAIHLLFSANRWEAMEHMEKTLKAGTHIVVDRYAFSGVAFSSAKGLDATWCRQPDVGLLKPDLVLFLDLPIEEAEKRGGFGLERYETKQLQMQVRQEFKDLMDDSWKIVNAAQSEDQVHQDMWTAIESLIGQKQQPPLEYSLWKTS
ncbi:deoxythymidylate kinase [Syncephalastrum racemosum]|uniref:Thymidylate kinase n=1 Tax=Syncephalastrum racemosum TaxID=13706 RepID=A0A1X2H5X3_SYNRA|nr:deoxythymidylate kinase [Syncephalastrum racemosum]